MQQDSCCLGYAIQSQQAALTMRRRRSRPCAAELGAAEVDHAAAELGAAEFAAIEDCSGEVGIQAAPILKGSGAVLFWLEVCGNNAYDGVPDFPECTENLMLSGGCVVCGFGLVRHAQ